MTTLFGLVKLIIYGEDSVNKLTKWEFVEENHEKNDEVKVEQVEVQVNKQEPVELEKQQVKQQPEEEKQQEKQQEQEEQVEHENNHPKKKKKKKIKNKKRSNSINSPEESKKVVHWGDVEEILFARDLGFHTIPHNGLYPLGLGAEESRHTSSLKKHLSATKIRLIERAIKLGLDITTLKNDSNTDNNESKHHSTHNHDEDDDENDDDYNHNDTTTANNHQSTPMLCLETRQYDYRSGCNMLFRPLSESDRIVVLGSLSRQSTLSDGTTVSSLSKEITEIRKSRDEVGCNCKQMKLDKLNVARLKQELISYQKKLVQAQNSSGPQNNNNSPSPTSTSTGTDPADAVHFDPDYVMLTNKQIDSLSKNELVNRLRGVFKSCPLCVLSDCDCFKLEIGCHSNCCSCFRSNSIKNNCNNSFGYHIYDSNKVNEYRSQFITCKTKHTDNNKQATNSSSSTSSTSTLTTTNNNSKIVRRNRANST